MVLLRRLLGDALRRTRQRQDRTLREVSSAARVSLGYLSEVERGQKEASSELLASICQALGIRLADLLDDVRDQLAGVEPARPAALHPRGGDSPEVVAATALGSGGTPASPLSTTYVIPVRAALAVDPAGSGPGEVSVLGRPSARAAGPSSWAA